MWTVLLVWAIAVQVVTSQFPPRQNKTWPARIYPGMEQFPSRDVLTQLMNSLDGEIITPTDGKYPNVTSMYNARLEQFPFSVVMVESIQDISRVCTFNLPLGSVVR